MPIGKQYVGVKRVRRLTATNRALDHPLATSPHSNPNTPQQPYWHSQPVASAFNSPEVPTIQILPEAALLTKLV
ncbi:UDP-glucuronosyltransferase 3A1-like protein [Corchorus olitorius]|uniref:UDP-glucuronosyltransferase 3A1-like protein n=1 Tax=Corchorus olitorius TaxID=93759 RepID=A0A1R3L052_9ROSI|nr:UDP-glucuronosyltransferase 3A1-like protein [Corchorus olitorius]